MRAFVFAIATCLAASSFPNVSVAQNSWGNDPISELFETGVPRQPVQVRESPRAPDRPARYRSVRPRDSHRKSMDQSSRVVRAKAEVTIIDRDHVLITLTRRGIGAAGVR